MIVNMDKPKVGISLCLLGKNVRYNGGHKLDHYLKEILGKFVEFVPVCPEVEAGFGIPREAVHLIQKNECLFMVSEKTNKDLTNEMNSWISQKLPVLEKEELCGFIFKSKSPSCGVYRTRIYRENKEPLLNGRGLFAKEYIKKFPMIFFEEEGRLHNPVIRDNFIESIFINNSWNKIKRNLSINELLKFHKEIKYTLMSHSPKILKEMGFLVANSTSNKIEDIFSKYYELLKNCISVYSTRKSHKNVLDHIQGYFKKNLVKGEKAELKELINNYFNGLVPLIVPVTLINHYVKIYEEEYLSTQYYLNPPPLELMLRNHI